MWDVKKRPHFRIRLPRDQDQLLLEHPAKYRDTREAVQHHALANVVIRVSDLADRRDQRAPDTSRRLPGIVTARPCRQVAQARP